MSTRLLLSALAALSLTSIGQAQSAMPAAEPAAAAPSAAAVSRERDTLSVDFPDEDIKTILRNVADLFELNLVVPDTLVGKTSIKLRDVTWRQIFSVVLAPVNFTYIEDGNIIKIVSNDSLQVEPTSTEVFILNYAKAADIKPTVDGLVDTAAGGKILVDARSNALVVTERPSRMGRVRSIVEQLDKATDQVMIESKFIEVTDRDVRNIGVNWSSLSGYTVNAGPFSQTYDSSSAYNNRSGGTQTNLDVPYMQNGYNKLSQLTGNPPGYFGPQPTYVADPRDPARPAVVGPPAVPAYPGSFFETYPNNTVGSTLANTVVGDLARVKSAVFNAAEFKVVLSALKTLNSVKVVSNPTVVTLNNTEATLNVGEEYPIPNYTYNTERGAFEVSGFTYKPIGVILKVTPQVNSKGNIKMSVEPEVSIRNGVSNFGGSGGGSGAEIPIIASRKVKTQVALQSGYTAGIGGLITANKNNGSSKVPVLGDIPGLGRLFSHKSKDETTTNLLIFITANTVGADGASPEDMFDPRSVQAAGVTRDELPGQRIQKGGDLYQQAAPAQ